jgi:signal peptidase I
MLTRGLKTGIIVIAIFGFGLTALIGYRVLLLTFVRVPTAAMANTIIPGDYLVVRKRAFGEIKRGDLIIFKYPLDTSVAYVFRVVGLPGEDVEVRGKLVYINGMEVKERHVTVEPDIRFTGILQEISSEGSGEYAVFHGSNEKDNLIDFSEANAFGITSPFRVPADSYYVMGDNRDNSSDSRFWGTVPRNLIVGKPTMIYWSEQMYESESKEPRWDRIFKKLR